MIRSLQQLGNRVIDQPHYMVLLFSRTGDMLWLRVNDSDKEELLWWDDISEGTLFESRKETEEYANREQREGLVFYKVVKFSIDETKKLKKIFL